MSQGSGSWLDRAQGLPRALRVAGTLVLPVLVLTAGQAYPGTLSPVHLQLALLASVVLAALLLGLAAGLACAALGFAILLWAAFQADAGGTLTLSLGSVLDAFLWFALAKLIVVLIALPHGTITRMLEVARQSDLDRTRKELLFNEMSHRVSNDISSVGGMLHMQAGTDPEAAAALYAAADRVLMFGRVHGRLSRNGAPDGVVDSRLFLEGLLADLRASLDSLRPITLVVDAEAHALHLARAGDMGLVVNELVTNALKHAFPGGREGIVRVTFRRLDTLFHLSVADNGVGFPPGQQPRPTDGSGLGSRILRALATQLGGRLDVVSGEVGGSICSLEFPAASSISTGPAAVGMASMAPTPRRTWSDRLTHLRRSRNKK
jgi:two-component sensor histidine kinase